MAIRRLGLLAAVSLLVTGAIPSCGPELVGPRGPVPAPLPAVAGLERPVSWEADVKPVLDARCVACHACYDSPCQLNLGSAEGAARGASKQSVYDTTRLKAMDPTRLFVDAHGAAAWRERGFFSVLGEAEVSGVRDPAAALVLQMLALGRAGALPPGERVPDSVPLDPNRSLSCATSAELPGYAEAHPHGGMPYAMAPLADEELRVLASWVVQAPPVPPPPALPATALRQAADWEAFLNGPSLKERIVARYLYEHWFVAHLTFPDLPEGPFFRVIRSRTAPGQPPDEIATRRPYDDPGATFWYRIVPVPGTIVHKTHIVYALGPDRLAHLRELFLGADWTPTRLPGYEPEEAANPFVAFDQIPARSRYQFLLDDAHYFVMTFIRGPVCRGQVAVDVIEDHFFIAFLSPDRDLSVVDPHFLDETKELLSLPAENQGAYVPGDLWVAYDLKQRKYLKRREQLYDALDPKRHGPALDWIWDGGGRNPNAQLAVFRNFDNATVVKGFVGGVPKTAWIMDYPIFERIYYDLVAGYDVYGDVVHQVSTRLYMDHLRMQSENLFLTFLPADRRQAIRASWYVGAKLVVDFVRADGLHTLDHGTQIHFHTDDPKRELLDLIAARSPAVSGPPDTLNRCADPPCDRPDATPAERAAERALQPLAAVKGPWVAQLPEVSLVRVREDPAGEHDLVYSLVHNDAHTNVAFMFGEDDRRVPADDTASVMRGPFGSYPNFVFEVRADELDTFAAALRAVRSDADFALVAGRWGLRRTSTRFWTTWDWLNADLRRRNPTTAGLYDLGRYANP